MSPRARGRSPVQCGAALRRGGVHAPRIVLALIFVRSAPITGRGRPGSGSRMFSTTRYLVVDDIQVALTAARAARQCLVMANRKDILEVLGDLDNGRAVDKISAELRNIMQACNARQVSGRQGAARIVPQISTKRPGPPLEAHSYDVPDDGDLSTQLSLPVDLGPGGRGGRRSAGNA